MEERAWFSLHLEEARRKIISFIFRRVDSMERAWLNRNRNRKWTLPPAGLVEDGVLCEVLGDCIDRSNVLASRRTGF